MCSERDVYTSVFNSYMMSAFGQLDLYWYFFLSYSKVVIALLIFLL